ncbi:band 4.1-like protein 4 isoform X2 [Tachypleus tridentatus]|uniref:band 4.1-like protein 4 isoform X2 n=1 Tax=Tachypleus tridentatus TaxID=6853 RepID=UPI003FD0EAD7
MKCFGEKPKTRHCKISLLDETELIQEIQGTTRGQDLLDVVFKHLNLLETAYFGLRFVDYSGHTHWLEPTKKVVKQLKGTSPCTLSFNVKFYASDPCKLAEEITRYQFFLQVKQDILQGRLPVSFELAPELFAYSVQSELGDYDYRRHHSGYISEFKFLTHQTEELEAEVLELHKGLVGQEPATAELNFLERVKWLDMYGVDLHPLTSENNIEYFLGLTPSGVIVLRNNSKVENYFWPRITKVYFKGKYFILRVRDKDTGESTYGYELPSKQACKHLWKCCVEHHAFFRLTQFREVPGNSRKVFGLNSRFHFSKTQKQMQVDLELHRPQPTVTRVPSRRYNKKLCQPDGADGNKLKEEPNENGLLENRLNTSVPEVVTPLQPMCRSSSVPSALLVSESPRNARSAPWEHNNHRGLYSNSTNPSPRSVKSSGGHSSSHFRIHQRSISVESDSSCDSRRRRHHHSRKSSDNDSEVSKSSRGSKTSKSSRNSISSRKQCSQYKDTCSGSESEGQRKHKKHRRHKSGSTYELVDSEAQWKLVQQQQQENNYLRPQNAVVRELSNRKSGYHNSGMETESEATFQHKKKHRRHRSRSKSPEIKKGLPEELKKHIEYTLIDSETMTEEERKNIKYTKVETDSRVFKIHYSPTTGQVRCRIARAPSKNSPEKLVNQHSIGNEDSPPPPYTENSSMPQGTSLMPKHTSSIAVTTQLKDTVLSDNNSNIIASSRPISGVKRLNLPIPVSSISGVSPMLGEGFVQAQLIPPKINHSFIQNQNLDTKNNSSTLHPEYTGSQTKLPSARTLNGKIHISGLISTTTTSSPRVTFQRQMKPIAGEAFRKPLNPGCSYTPTDFLKSTNGPNLQCQDNLEMSTEL